VRWCILLPAPLAWCQKVYSLTADTIKKQLPSRDKVSVGVDRWTLKDKLAITSVTAYCMNSHWALREVQLTHNKIDTLFCSYFESWLSIIMSGSTYWRMTSHIFEKNSSLFWAYQLLFDWNYDSKHFLKLLDDSATTINPSRFQNQSVQRWKPTYHAWHTWYG